MKDFNCPKCHVDFNFVHICKKSNLVLRWHGGRLRIALLEPEYNEYELSCTEEEAQEKINKFISNLIFI